MYTDDGMKRMGAAVLAELLWALPEESSVYVNQVGNLSVVQNGIYIGFIDFANDCTEMFDTTEEP